MDKTNYTDDQLIAMIQSGDDTARKMALEHVFRSWYDDAKKWILRYGGEPYEADDAATEAIIILDNHIRTRKYKKTEGATLKGYFLGICYWQRRSMRDAGKRYYLPAEIVALIGQDFQTPEVLMLETEQKEFVRKLLEKLGDRCREVLKMWALSYSPVEIAQAMSTTYGYARQMVFDCKNKLKGLLGNNRF